MRARRTAAAKLHGALRAARGGALCVALCVLSSCSGGSSAPPRNFLLISIDCLNQRQTVEALKDYEVPTLAALARESLLFTRAYTHAPWTNPSHMSMLSGLYPRQHGRDVPWGLMIDYRDLYDRVPKFPNLATLLGEAGYDTAGFVGRGPTSAAFGLGAGFDHYEETAKNRRSSDFGASVEAFAGWLDARPEDAGPFFTFLHTFDFHGPRPTKHKSDRRALMHIDRDLSQLMKALEERGLAEETVIVLTGDHGSRMERIEEKCCAHGVGHYEENLKVPLWLRVPGSEGKRGRSEVIARHVDLLPTILDLAGVRGSSYDGPGVSLLAEPKEGAEPRLSFSEADGRCVLRYALVGKRFKYIYTPRGPGQDLLRANERFYDRVCPETCLELPPSEELFDLDADPFEEDDLLRSGLAPGAGEALEEMRLAMQRHLNLEPRWARSLVTPDSPTPAAIDPELIKSLEALGYL